MFFSPPSIPFHVEYNVIHDVPFKVKKVQYMTFAPPHTWSD